MRKRRAEGTPCNKENFLAWKERFDKEMEELRMAKEDELGQQQQQSQGDRTGKKSLSKKRSELEEMENRLTGYQQFCDKLGLASLDALEKAAEEAQYEEEDDNEGEYDDNGDVNVDELDLDEELFDDDDEDDLDDLDFDSDEDDSDDDEIDI